MGAQASLQSWLKRQWQVRGIWSFVMWPFAWVYGAVASARRSAYLSGSKVAFRCGVPVIVVGNIYVGGTGKTPISIAIIEALQAAGWHPGLISRGYGRRSNTDPVTGMSPLGWETVGDEPALIAHHCQIPVSVDKNRSRAARSLLQTFPEVDIIISDDGLQHYALARDIEVALQDERGVGNGLELPAGPLREPPKRLDTVDILLTRTSRLDRTSMDCANSGGTHPVRGCFRVVIDHFSHLASGKTLSVHDFAAYQARHRPLLAVAGIGVPERFFNSLKELGIDPDTSIALADHEPIGAQWLNAQRLERTGTILITEKDAIKCTNVVHERVWVAHTTVVSRDSRWLDYLLQRVNSTPTAGTGVARTKR